MRLGAWTLMATHLEKIGKHIEKHIGSVYMNFSARVSKSTLSSLLAAFIHTYMLTFTASSLRKNSASTPPRGCGITADSAHQLDFDPLLRGAYKTLHISTTQHEDTHSQTANKLAEQKNAIKLAPGGAQI